MNTPEDRGRRRRRRLLSIALAALLVGLCLVLALAQRRDATGKQERPRRVTSSATPGTAAPPNSRTINVRARDNLQAAIDAARPGDTILVEAGASFRGPFTLPDKGSGSAWITIRTSAPDSQLPPPGSRITPAHSHLLPKLLAPTNQSALQTAPGAHHYRLLGLEFRPVAADTFIYDLVRLGDGSSAQSSRSQLPHHLHLDRSIVTAYPTQDIRRGIALNSGAETEITNCHVSEIKSLAYDSQAIGGWNGSGPYRITNNYLEAAGENILLGGAPPGIAGIMAEDVQILRNHLYKPLRWRPSDASYAGQRWLVKALLEIKSGRRVRIEGNVLENCWGEVSAGYAAVNLTVRGDSGPQATIEDVEFRHNIVRHAAAALNVLGRDTEAQSGQGRGLRIVNNLFADIDGERWGESGRFLKVSNMREVEVDHNTVWQSTTVVWAYGEPQAGFVFTNNIIRHNNYGIHGVNTTPGNGTLSFYFPGAVVRRNVIIGADESVYPANNFYPARLSENWFADFRKGDYRLREGGSLKGRSTDGKDLGCDFDALATATEGVVFN